MRTAVIILSIVFFGCNTHKYVVTDELLLQKNPNPYFISKIDSINNFYVIYAKRNDSLFKIVSKKEAFLPRCNKIALNQSYPFDLTSMLSINGERIIPNVSVHEVAGLQLNDSTIIEFENESRRDLYSPSNLKGLCLISNH